MTSCPGIPVFAGTRIPSKRNRLFLDNAARIARTIKRFIEKGLAQSRVRAKGCAGTLLLSSGRMAQPPPAWRDS